MNKLNDKALVSDQQSEPVFWVRQSKQIRALESPMRQEIVDALSVLGPASIVDLAEHLGRAADSLYFHVKKLVNVKLVQEVEKRRQGRHVWAIYALPSRSVRLVYDSSPNRSVRNVVAGALRLSLRELGHALAEGGHRLSGPQRNVWGARIKGWLSPEDCAEMNRLLERLVQVMNRNGPGPGRTVHSLAWMFSPSQVRSRQQSNHK
jgi:DNA-binding transcriptional ArsR family regulator